MDAKKRDLALFAARRSLVQALPGTVDHPVFSSVFFVLGVVAIVGVVEKSLALTFTKTLHSALQCPAAPLARPLAWPWARFYDTGHRAKPPRSAFNCGHIADINGRRSRSRTVHGDE
jgi:hypothetical protein